MGFLDTNFMITLTYWAVFAAIVAIASAVSAAIIGGLKIKKSWAEYLISWVSAIALAFVAYGLKFLPALGEPWWAFVLLQGFVMGLVSNKFYDIEWVKKLYKLIFGEDYEITIVLEEEAGTSTSPLSQVMKFQKTLAKYIKVEDGKVKLTVKK